MATSTSSPLRARFEPFEVELTTGELWKTGVAVAIQEQPLQVLRLLLQANGEVVTREQLRFALWPENTFVDFEHGVNTAVKKLRHALEDSADRPIFIETLPRVGYRFIAPVEWSAHRNSTRLASAELPTVLPEPVSAPEATPQKPAWNRKPVIAWSALALLILAVVSSRAYIRSRFQSPPGQAASRLSPESQPGLRQRRLTANPNDTPLTGGVISPDGKHLVFADPTGLYLRQVDGGETFPVPLAQGVDALPESWFPDGLHLVVRGLQHSGRGPSSLWDISVIGGAPRKLAEDGLLARVSPDGSKIAFVVRRAEGDEIWLIERDTNTARRIIAGGKDRFGPVAWSPSARKFAYLRTSAPSGHQIEVFDIATGRKETILSNPALGSAIAWVTAGRLIYSLLEPQSNQRDSNLWWIPVEPQTGHPSGPPARITNDRGQLVAISVTRDGKRLALLRNILQSDVYMTDLIGQGKRLGTPRRFTLDDRNDDPFSWTPDSQAVLFVSDRGESRHIWKQRIDQVQPELLVGGKGAMWTPRVAPDRASLLYLVTPKPGEAAEDTRIMKVQLSGGPSRSVLEAPHIYNHACAQFPSGVCVYSQINPGEQKFFTFSPSGGAGSEIVPAYMKEADAPCYNWGLSPDGRFLATTTWIGQQKDFGLRLIELETGVVRQFPVKGPAGELTGVDWAANSKSIWLGGYIQRGPWSRTGLMNVDLNGKVTAELRDPNLSTWSAIASPDGRHLAVLGHTEDSNVSLLEDF